MTVLCVVFLILVSQSILPLLILHSRFSLVGLKVTPGFEIINPKKNRAEKVIR
jgi:hypothetical protein